MLKISSLIGQYLEICVCPWEPARTFCCHFMRFFHWLIGPKLNLCQWVLFSPSFCSSFSPLHSNHFVDVGRGLCFSPLHSGYFVHVGRELCFSPLHSDHFVDVGREFCFYPLDSDHFVDVGRELCWGSMGLCGLILVVEVFLVVGVLMSWAHVFGVIFVVCMLSFVSMSLLFFVSFSPPSWWTISVVVLSLLIVVVLSRERFNWKRVVVSSSGSSSLVVASKVTCVFSFNFFLICPCCCSPGLVFWTRDRRFVVVVRAFRLASACRPCCFSFIFLVLVLVLCSICVLVLILDFGLAPPSLVLCLWSLVFSLHCLTSCAA